MGMHAQGPEIRLLTGPHVVLTCTNVGGPSFYKEEYNELPGSSKIGKNFACISESTPSLSRQPLWLHHFLSFRALTTQGRAKGESEEEELCASY